MKAFKTGTREATIMHQIAKGYSDEQIQQMADYFASQKP
jgi:cytochrome c553